MQLHCQRGSADAARKVLERAKALASSQKTPFLTVQHLFSVLADSEAPIIADFFSGAKLNAKDVAKQAAEYDPWTGPLEWISKGVLHDLAGASIEAKDVVETPRVLFILALAEKAREQTGAPSVDPMHLLTAILQEAGSHPVVVLRQMGQDADRLALMATRLATAHYAPEDKDEEKGGTKQVAPPPPKHPPRKPVDHNTWIAARELTDALLAIQVQFQMADPRERFDAAA